MAKTKRTLELFFALLCLSIAVQAGLLQSKQRQRYTELSTVAAAVEGTDPTPPSNITTDSPNNSTTDSPFNTTLTAPPSTATSLPDSGSGVVVRGDCAFDINGELNDPAPIFTPHNHFDWLVPNAAGVVELSNGAYIDMYCSTSFMAPFTNRTKVTAQCLQKKYFLVDGLIYPFANFSCTAWPAYTARRTGRPCNGGTDLLEVGFELEAGFLPTMDICHDEVNEVTRYVHHVLNPSSNGYQHGVSRPSFITGDFYNGKNVNNLYTKVEQNKTISQILGMDASPYFNDTIDVYMARGHMAAKVDFIFGAPQKATFYFVNAAPQWQMFNGGNWERIEDGVRRFASDQALTLDCYTGIWGVSTLPDVNGVQQELYLAFDENNNGLIPVPMLYFRVVIDRESRKGIVLLGVNNPHISLEEIKRDYVICKDVGRRIDWIGWNKDNLMKGYSYACAVDDFLKVVTHLPLEDLHTTGLLGVEELKIENAPIWEEH
ncbi:uncharacterized protein LOC118740129 [Rhagoletis pomonella]|uniref:uncharacterized protein LOC118740129 n=1 Tax=Rhagoletis pomonella TaxID=28610 RepID=UPI0017850521|nr:uncharacterized protein LOC118740129 [Rhagoletis pomonella]